MITDNKIKKALKRCAKKQCSYCPLHSIGNPYCEEDLKTESANRINRLQTDKDFLKAELSDCEFLKKELEIDKKNLETENERLKKELNITRAYLHDKGLEFDLLSYSERIGG